MKMKHPLSMIKNTVWLLCLAVGLLMSCQSSTPSSAARYVLSTQYETALSEEELNNATALKPDTIRVHDPVQAYSMGVQRYAAGMLFIHQHLPKDAVQLQGIQINREDGTPINELTTQAQRDSVIMDFLKFARKSTIPYYEHVKLFETDMMRIR
jgi:hypothetical protein